MTFSISLNWYIIKPTFFFLMGPILSYLELNKKKTCFRRKGKTAHSNIELDTQKTVVLTNSHQGLFDWVKRRYNLNKRISVCSYTW